MGRQIDKQRRDQIAADIKQGTHTTRAIATKHNISVGTVNNIAKEYGLIDAFDRSLTKSATEALVFDAKAARAQLVKDLYGDAQRMRNRVWSEHQQLMNTKEGIEIGKLDLPPMRDQQAGFTSVAICLDKAAMLERADDDQGAGTARNMTNDLFTALALQHLKNIGQ